MGASRPNKELAYGEQNLGLRPNGNPPTAVNNTGALRLTTGASRPNKELAYGEQNLRRMETRLRRAITQALRTQALRARTKSSPTASKIFGLWKPAFGGQ